MEGSELFVTLMGGVALLLWSVRMVRTGMTRAFGASLRSLLGKACSNRAKAFAVGVGVTGLLQSATATALLLASFASRKLVTLPLALAIMLGADVGTALVAQVYSIDIKWIWAALLFIGVVLFNASEKDHIRGGGRILIGFGLMLLGLTIIGQVSGQLRDSPISAPHPLLPRQRARAAAGGARRRGDDLARPFEPGHGAVRHVAGERRRDRRQARGRARFSAPTSAAPSCPLRHFPARPSPPAAWCSATSFSGPAAWCWRCPSSACWP